MLGSHWTPETSAALVRDACDVLAQSEGERQVIEAALQSVFSSIQKVPQAKREHLQELIAAFIGEPGDRPTIQALGELLRDARAANH